MDCSSQADEFNAQMLYECETTLNGIKNRVENKFYFRCMDQPEAMEQADRNVNKESYVFMLQGTQPLVIDWVKPNKTIKDSTDYIRIKLQARTSAGYKEGEAICYYKKIAGPGDLDTEYIEFFNTNSYEHSQELWLLEGNYTYSIKCVDLGGNEDIEQATFIVESDSDAPKIIKVYYESDHLKIITDEKAECVYNNARDIKCNYPFAEGIQMETVDGIEHYASWGPEYTYYIKCKDVYGNQPNPDQCSFIAKPFDILFGKYD